MKGLWIAIGTPLTLPIAAQWAPTLSPLKRGEGISAMAANMKAISMITS
jgi:hypothetical protein